MQKTVASILFLLLLTACATTPRYPSSQFTPTALKDQVSLSLGTVTGCNVVFNGSSSNLTPGYVIIIEYGDGYDESGDFPFQHTYEQSGTYTARAWASDHRAPDVPEERMAVLHVTVDCSPTATPEPQYATINGYIAYPSEGWCPKFNIYAVDENGRLGGFASTDGQGCGFSIQVPAPQRYIIYAWVDQNDPFASNLGKPNYPTSLSALYVGGDLQACMPPVPILVNPGDNVAGGKVPLAIYLVPCQYVPAPIDKG